jgi:hypothetical protein
MGWRKPEFIDLGYHGSMQGMGGFRTLFAHLAERRAAAGQGAFEWTPEAERRSASLGCDPTRDRSASANRARLAQLRSETIMVESGLNARDSG